MVTSWCKADLHEACPLHVRTVTGRTRKCQCPCDHPSASVKKPKREAKKRYEDDDEE